MKFLKKLLICLTVVTAGIGLAACSASSSGSSDNLTGSAEKIMNEIYEQIPEDQRPMMLMNTEIDSENVEYFLGTSDLDFKEAIASEPAVSSIAYSVVLVRMNKGADIEAAKTKIKDSVDPRKWICVEAETVKVVNRGDVILLIMASEKNAKNVEEAFNKL